MPRKKFLDQIYSADVEIIRNISGISEEDINVRRARLESDDKEQNIRLKLFTCRLILVIFATWLFLVMGLLFLVAYSNDFYLSDKVMIALLATTTVNIIALPLIILKGLFVDKNK